MQNFTVHDDVPNHLNLEKLIAPPPKSIVDLGLLARGQFSACSHGTINMECLDANTQSPTRASPQTDELQGQTHAFL